MQSFFLKFIHIFFLLLFITNIMEAKENIRFGVFAYLGVEETREKYQPLVDYLNRSLNKQVILEVLTQEEMNDKIARKELDIITTNPTHFLVIRSQYPMSGALATLVGYHEGQVMSKLGGLIIVRSDSTIQSIKDLANKRVATPSTKHMGGYRAQAYELYQNGVKNITVIETQGSHQEVVYDIINHKADVGFIRDGVLEGMIEKGEISSDDIRIINERHDTMHPYKVSTKLYPEWPIFALPHADNKDIKAFLAALLTFEPDNESIQKTGIYGYTLPADYLDVEQLARDMRLPPFDQAPTITIMDIWNQHQREIVFFGIFTLLFALYYLREQHRKRLFESLLSSMGDGVYGVDKKGVCIWINKKALTMLGYSEKEVLWKDQHLLFHHHKPSNEFYDVTECPIYLTLQDDETRHMDEYFIRRDGTFFPVSLTVSSNNHHGAIVVFRDITEQLEITQELQSTQSKLKELNLTLKHKNELLKELARYDGLTHIPNRRFFDEMYEKKYKEVIRENKSLAVLMIDVDYFKLYNDHYGHVKGDECLIKVAETLKNSLKRPTDFVARYGGEEFVVVLKNIDINGVLQVGQLLVESIGELKIVHEFSSVSTHVSVSIGIAYKESDDAISKDALLKKSDDALYHAKEHGRNQIHLG